MAPAQQPFYVAGGTLHSDVPSYVERRADIELFNALMQGQFCYLLDTRQIGKSSMTVRTAARLRENSVHVVMLDLTRVGQSLTSEQWYYSLLLDLGGQLGLRDEVRAFWQQNPELSPLRRWMEALRLIALPHLAPPDPQQPVGTLKPSSSLVIFVDEIDNVLSLPFSTDEFFAGIREIYTRRAQDPELNRLTFCLLGSATPNSLMRDSKTTPFNIGIRIEPTDFTETEAWVLATGLGSGGRNGGLLLRRILYWTGGHPYLTQHLCQAVAKESSVKTTRGVDRVCDQLFFNQDAQDKEVNLAFVGDRLLKSQEDLASLLSMYTRVRYSRKAVKDDPANPLCATLRLSGIVRIAAGYLWVRNRIYRQVFDRRWIEANMPGAELRRQQVAFRKGLARAGTLASVVVAAFGALAATALNQEHIAATALNQKQIADRNAADTQARADQANHKLYDADMITAHQKLEQQDAIGALQLLQMHQNDPWRGIEWSFLWREAEQRIARNGKLARVLQGRTVRSIHSQDEKLRIDFDDGSTMDVKTAAPPSSTATGGTVKAVRQKDTELIIDMEDGSSLAIQTVEPTSSVVVRDETHSLEYVD